MFRTVGLLNHVEPPLNQGFMLANTKSIHTRGMLFAIDVIALNAQLRVLEIVEAVKPGCRIVRLPPKTRHVLEMAAGTASSYFKEGDVLRKQNEKGNSA